MKNVIKPILVSAALLALTACPPPEVIDPVVPKSAVVKSFTASPTALAAGEKATLSWEVQDATGVAIATLDGTPVPLSDAKAAKGSVEVMVSQSSVYVLTAKGEGGGDSAASSVVVEEETPSALLAVSPTEVTAGQPVTVVWNAPKAAEVTITDEAGATVYSGAEPVGSVEVVPSASTQYTLTADDRTAVAQVQVNPLIVGFTANPPAAEPGAQVVLSWKAAGAESVSLSAEGRGELTSVTDAAQIADGSYTDTVPSELPAEGVVNYTLTAKVGSNITVQKLTVYLGAQPVITSFEVAPYAKAGAVFGVTWQTANANSVKVEVEGKVVYVASSQATVNAGSATLNSPAAATTVKLIVTNTRGGRAEASKDLQPVDVPVLVSFAANPSPTIANGGEPVTLTWEVTNARRAKITDSDGKLLTEVFGNSAETGSVQAYPNKQTTYTFVADNTVGDAIQPQTATIDVTTPAKLNFTPSTVPAGTVVQLTGSTVPNGGTMRLATQVVKNAPGTSFIDISATGTLIPVEANNDGDEVFARFPVPFSTSIMGTPVTRSGVTMTPNGVLVLTDEIDTSVGYPSSFPSTSAEPLAVVAFADDLETGNDTRFYYQLDGTGTQQRLIVQWTKIYEYPFDQNPTKHLTFQAQIHANGHVVIAFQDIVGYTSTDEGEIGLINHDETAAIGVTMDMHSNGMWPAPGDTFSFYGPVTLPFPIKALVGKPVTAIQQVGTGEIEITTQPGILPPGEFGITEVNFNPATGKEEWFEVTNNTANPIDLGGWDIDFGNGNVHTIAGTLNLPANGRLLFGQSADSTEASAGGPAIDYVYGTTFSMPDAAGSVSLSLFGGAYTTLAWTAAGTAGTSMIMEAPRPELVLSTTITSLKCAGTGTYGSGVQTGNPGQPNNLCLPWTLQPGTSLFEPIAFTGTVITGMASTTNNGIDSVTKAQALTRPVKVGNATFGTVYVSSNGWLSVLSTTSTNGSNLTTPTSTVPNGTFAIFWDDLAGNAGTTSTPSGVYWKQFDPDATPNTGDEYTLVSWENWKRYSSSTSGITSSLNFQVKFHEATGDVEYVYGGMTASNTTYANGNDATVWLEAADGLSAIKVLVNQPILQPNSAYRFVYAP